MKLFTPVLFEESSLKLQPQDRVFSIGSCFSSELSERLKRGQIQTCNNPFGTLFNPYSIGKAIKAIHDAKVYSEEDLIQYQDRIFSLDHHSSYASGFAHKTLEKINLDIEIANRFLQVTKWVVISFGTSFVHEFLPKQSLVANCHKLPGTYFKKRLLSLEELTQAMDQSVQDLLDIGPKDMQILFTLSPVRHTRDGMVENQRSKALLLTAMHEVTERYSGVSYLPIYELMLDELRDYRFYKEDLIHPSTQAVNYIFEQFGNAYFSTETMSFIEQNFKIMRDLEHKAFDLNDPHYVAFRKRLEQKIQTQRKIVTHSIFN